MRGSKYEPLVETVDLLDVNPNYAHVRLNNGRETTVSLRHLAPVGDTNIRLDNESDIVNGDQLVVDVPIREDAPIPDLNSTENTMSANSDPPSQSAPEESQIPCSINEETTVLRRSSRNRRNPSYLADNYQLY